MQTISTMVGESIAAIMKYPTVGDRSNDELFHPFFERRTACCRSTRSPDGGATVSIWVSQEARDAYMMTMLKSDVDAALPGLTHEVEFLDILPR